MNATLNMIQPFVDHMLEHGTSEDLHEIDDQVQACIVGVRMEEPDDFLQTIEDLQALSNQITARLEEI